MNETRPWPDNVNIGTGSRIQTAPRIITSSFDVALSLLNQYTINPFTPCWVILRAPIFQNQGSFHAGFQTLKPSWRTPFFYFLTQITHLTAVKILKKSVDWKIFLRSSLSFRYRGAWASVTKIEIRSRHLYYFGSFLWLRYLKILLYMWSFSEARYRQLTTIFCITATLWQTWMEVTLCIRHDLSSFPASLVSW